MIFNEVTAKQFKTLWDKVKGLLDGTTKVSAATNADKLGDKAASEYALDEEIKSNSLWNEFTGGFDLNNALGKYRTKHGSVSNTLLNFPPTSLNKSACETVVEWLPTGEDNAYGTQKATLTLYGNIEIFVRQKDNTTWGGWVRIATTKDLANYLPRDGGNVDGNVTMLSNSAVDRDFTIKNSKREILSRVSDGGGYILHDITNGKRIIESAVDGTNTFNGIAENANFLSVKNSDEVNFKGLNGKDKMYFNFRDADTNGIDSIPLSAYVFGNKSCSSTDFIQLVMNQGSGTRYILHTGNSAKVVVSNTPLTAEGAVRVW